MKIGKLILVAIPGALLGLAEPAMSQTKPSDACPSPNTTSVIVSMSNGTQLRFALERDGGKMRGAALYDGGRGTLSGEFSGQYVFWEIVWEDGSQAVFSGQFAKGDGSGTAFHSSNKNSRINWTARTADGCPKWPDATLAKPAQPQDECARLGLPKVGDKCGCPAGLTQDITGRCVASTQEAAKPTQQAAKCSGGRVGTPPNCECPQGRQWSGRSCVVVNARTRTECPAGTTRLTSGECAQAVHQGLGLGVLPALGGALNVIQQLRGAPQGGQQ
jgi:hypothetical protein